MLETMDGSANFSDLFGGDIGVFTVDTNMRMGKISNITNSSDPHAINSRIFVGNLNTFTLTKDDVECVFKRYGRIIGISMHKGYAFVQYTSEVDARNAVAGEDQRVYATQPIDVNMASEPKPNRPSRKRPQGAGAEWDYYYNAPLLPRGVLPPPLKRPRPDLAALPPGLKAPPGLAMMAAGFKRTLVPLGGTAAVLAKRSILSPKHRLKGKGGMPAKDQPSSALETPDILICGQCKQLFPNLEKLAEHKQVKCRLRVVTTFSAKSSGREEPLSVTCATCQTEFCSSWDLIVHAQQEHSLTIFAETSNNNSSDHGETQSDAGSSKAGESSDTENKTTEGANSDMADGDVEQESLADGVVIIQQEEEEENADLDESYSAAIEQSILQQAMESDQQQGVVGVGNGEQ